MTHPSGRELWVSVDQAARLAAASSATVRGWVRRGAVRSLTEGAQTMVRIDDVASQALARQRASEPAVLQTQVETALTELAKAADAVTNLEAELDALRDKATELDEQYTRRAQWAGRQHEREMRETYARWEQERAQWEQERSRLVELASPPTATPAASNGHVPAALVTSRPPISDDLLPPLHATPEPEPEPRPGDITPGSQGRAWWRQLRA